MYYRFSAVTNGLSQVNQLAACVPQGFSSTVGRTSDILLQSGERVASMNRLTAKTPMMVQQARHAAWAPSAHADHAPAKHDDHHHHHVHVKPSLNDGIPPEHLVAPYGDPNKMLGVGGKLIDKLPKGTKVGNLVMGDHGLYCPKLREKQMKLLEANLNDITPYEALTGFHRVRGKLSVYASFLSGGLGLFCCYCVIFNYNPFAADKKKE